ncbi:hypothetical protein [Deinococcus cellulosilyticus]|uniref:Uncharacterized protein n=1 Tax=Deinococcus cellulosilyticus (strain DSM 18568 / NBRC 106333 / KACC 11606 / 5516J-15) TaxID=1223518 RepID=A0A511N4D1_DEIC1|nr:hypothetical protein [Deinococcus cellulosilyticus]GEM47730.1 hypothetical protein DC3_33650 [Deinococcus cellulosilyticus NBRC 106333 = KACC 11606]
MDGNHNLYAYLFVRGILEMREPPTPEQDAQPRIQTPKWWQRLWKKEHRNQPQPEPSSRPLHIQER